MKDVSRGCSKLLFLSSILYSMVLYGINKWMNGAPGVVPMSGLAASTLAPAVQSTCYQILQEGIAVSMSNW